MQNSELISTFLDELSRHITGELRTDTYNRLLYSTDASIYQVMPHGVLIPQTMDDVQAAVELAAKYKLPLLPRTAGSSLAGQAVNEALVIDFTRHLDGVLELNVEERWVRVRPGLVLDQLNHYLRPHGLQFGPDPASSNRAAMGGIVSNNSTGSHSIMYGMTADHVLDMNVILNDGSTVQFGALTGEEIERKVRGSGREAQLYQHLRHLTQNPANQATIRAGTPRHWRRCGGYNLDRLIPQTDQMPTYNWPHDPRWNLAKLICGAEGTLAVITDLKLNLVPIPQKTALAIIHFDELFTALSAVPAILQVEPSAVELMDNLGLTMCRDVPAYARLLNTFLNGQPNSILITEFYGETTAELNMKIGRLKRLLSQEKLGSTGLDIAYAPQLQANVWKVRKVGLGLLMSIKGDHKPIPFIEDAAVPVAHLADYVTRLEQFCNHIGTKVAYYAHASAGCVHVRPLMNTKDAKDLVKLEQIMSFSVELLGEYGGSLSSEHGDGRVRSWANEAFFGKDLYALYQQVKGIFDPDDILNPGNVVNAPAMTADLRYGNGYDFIPLKTHLDFRVETGFDRAVEQCNGAGICRKLTVGTMCPSFMVTREEEHSTRGRANLLRAVLSGRLPAGELTNPRLYQAMDLCIGCKACKAECPSSVDMAKIKFEYLAHYHDANGIPLRSRFFANIGTLSRLGSGRFAPLVNRLNQTPLARRALQKTLGISPKRPLPTFARQTYFDWYNQHHPPHATHHPPRLVLFNDTFTTYQHPHIAIMATQVLQAAGFDVIPSGHLDEGRPAISKGLVDHAKQAARKTVSALAPYAAGGIPIIGLEPSSLLTLRDEYLYLLPDDPQAELVAQHALTFEEFVAQLAEAGELNLAFTQERREVLLHGHCHLKALVGTEPSKRVLSLPPNYTVTEVDSGCCGMAGSFGYEAEHYAISMQMAERRLLPAVRSASPETIIAASGVSCREQIGGGSGREALHPAEILWEAMVRTEDGRRRTE